MAHRLGEGRFLRQRRARHPSATPASSAGCARSPLDHRRGHRVYPVSGEAIILGDDCVGFTTTANFGDTIGKPIAYGYVPVEHLERTDWVIEVYGEPIPATRHDGALYDPKGARLRA